MPNEQWNVLNPIANIEISKSGGATRLDDFRGKRIGLWWNGKSNGDIFLDAFAGELTLRYPGMETVRLWEIDPATTTAYGVAKGSLAHMAQRADLVIGALSD
ncbi:MAG: hypothetical protein ACKVQK_14040 [Burkholderiales bacterium]